MRVEIEAWVDPDIATRQADEIGRQAADPLARQLPDMNSFTWATRAVPA